MKSISLVCLYCRAKRDEFCRSATGKVRRECHLNREVRASYLSTRIDAIVLRQYELAAELDDPTLAPGYTWRSS